MKVFPESQLAHRYLDGYRGIEIGASVHNPFNIPGCLNVDFTDSTDTEWKQEEIERTGATCQVDIVAEGDTLPFPDSSLDYVLSSHSLEHFPDPIKTLKEWARVVKPGGLLFLILPQPDAHKADKDKPLTTLDDLEWRHIIGQNVDSLPPIEGHEKRGHYSIWSYASFKAFLARFFADTLLHIDGEPIDSKVGNGHTHVLRVTKPTPDGSPRIDLKPTRYRVWVNLPDETGCTLYRQFLPWHHCHEALAAEGIDLIPGGEKGGHPADSSYDAYLLQRCPQPGVMAFVHWIAKEKRTIVWDIDDDFTQVPEWSPARKDLENIGAAVTMPVFFDQAHTITVTNAHLAGRIEEDFDFLRGKTRVLPNLIDAARWESFPLRRDPNRPPRILWAGSSYHKADLELLIPVVERLVGETDWQFLFIGDIPERLRHIDPTRLLFLGGAHIKYYPAMLRELAPDVGLCPLTGSLFDKSKSPIKWMEYTLSGAAVVATDCDPYRSAIDHGRTGMLADNDLESWCECLHTAVDRCRELHAAARHEVLTKHSWQSPARNLWLDFFRDIARPAANA